MIEKDKTERGEKAGRSYLPRDVRRVQIVEASKPIFLERGFRNTTIEDILHASGIAQGTLYLHFRSKNEIFREVMIGCLHRIQEIVRASADVQSGLSMNQDAVADYIYQKNLNVLREVYKDRDLIRIILREAPGLGPEIDEILRLIRDMILTQVKTELALLKGMGLVGEIDPDLTARMLLGTMVMAMIGPFIDDERDFSSDDIERLAHEITDFQLYGYLKHGTSGQVMDNPGE